LTLLLLTDMLARFLDGLTKAVKAGLVAFVVAVREVETSHAHARINESFEHWDIPASGTKRADNLGLASFGVSRLGDGLQRNVGSSKFRSLSSFAHGQVVQYFILGG
jgi:hypothetical protein